MFAWNKKKKYRLFGMRRMLLSKEDVEKYRILCALNMMAFHNGRSEGKALRTVRKSMGDHPVFYRCSFKGLDKEVTSGVISIVMFSTNTGKFLFMLRYFPEEIRNMPEFLN